MQVTVSVAPFSDCPVLCAEPAACRAPSCPPPLLVSVGVEAVRASPPRGSRAGTVSRACVAHSHVMCCEIRTPVPTPAARSGAGAQPHPALPRVCGQPPRHNLRKLVT